MKDRVRRLERDEDLERFQLEDGTWVSYDKMDTRVDLFLFTVGGYLDRHGDPEGPEPPPIQKALCNARDRRAAGARFFSEGQFMFPYDVDAIVERGELVRRSLVSGYEVGEPLPGDLSED